jgi:hypothetical protein
VFLVPTVVRAAFSLDHETLPRHTADPLGDVSHGRYERLVAALVEDTRLSANSVS